MKTKPDLSFWKLWNLSFGFFGVQIAYALQSSQVSRIFSTIGADPHQLSYFWILPPLMGFLVQPIIGSASDRTWNRFGRRLPYLIVGAAIAIIVMCFLPNAGSLGLSVSAAITFGLFCLMLLDTSINMAMQPFKMLVGDMVNEKQKGLAYSIQSFLCNAGSFVGYLAPIILALFVSNQAPEGEVPPTVTFAFYLGALILLICVLYTLAKVKEMPPKLYAEYNGVAEEESQQQKKGNMFVQMAGALKTAPAVFWTIGLVQFFCWAGFLFLWTYSTDAIAGHAFDAPSEQKVDGVEINGTMYSDKYLFADEIMVIDDGRLTINGVNVNGIVVYPDSVMTADGQILVKGGQVFYDKGVALARPGESYGKQGDVLLIDGEEVTLDAPVSTVITLSTVTPDHKLSTAHIVVERDGKYEKEQVAELPSAAGAEITPHYTTVLNAQSKQYQDAGDWNGVLFAIQAVVAVIWAAVLPRFKNRRFAYSISLVIGAVGFIAVYFCNSKWALTVPYGLMGCGWAAMLAMPFTILTNALSGKNIGTYLGLFNCTICFPQIIAALLGGLILGFFPLAAAGTPQAGAPQTVYMIVVAGVLMLLGAVAVWNIKEVSAEKQRAEAEAAA
ncbi:MAG: SLC45 family MFS transporter [Barnesiella sp.]|nr:SLC45 family MFS transporter [Barnesiella sp.]MBD5248361.1 SLC45 family MFS transporter [Barnesiella sp.]